MTDDLLNRVRVTVLPGGRVDRRNAAAYLGRRPLTLAAWAKNGVGPSHRLVGGRAFYDIDELERFASGGRGAAA